MMQIVEHSLGKCRELVVIDQGLVVSGSGLTHELPERAQVVWVWEAIQELGSDR